jgi:hypothetical protein
MSAITLRAGPVGRARRVIASFDLFASAGRP